MPYVMSVERIGIKKGRAEGELKGKADLVIRLLTNKFGTVPPDTERQIRYAEGPFLDIWAERILGAGTLADVFGSDKPH